LEKSSLLISEYLLILQKIRIPNVYFNKS
jgi:hypothetical protein